MRRRVGHRESGPPAVAPLDASGNRHSIRGIEPLASGSNGARFDCIAEDAENAEAPALQGFLLMELAGLEPAAIEVRSKAAKFGCQLQKAAICRGLGGLSGRVAPR